MTNKEVFRAFAKYPRAKGKSSNGTVYFRDGVLYSYRDSWPLVALRNGQWYINTDKASATTSKHLSQAQAPLRDEYPRFAPVRVELVEEMRKLVERADA
jgi:hypothetical protein